MICIKSLESCNKDGPIGRAYLISSNVETENHNIIKWSILHGYVCLPWSVCFKGKSASELQPCKKQTPARLLDDYTRSCLMFC